MCRFAVLIFSAPGFVNGVLEGIWRRVFPHFWFFKWRPMSVGCH
jgi:hypothetical protein